MLYLTLKTIHIISATLLFGTGLGSAYYMLRAHLTNNPQVIAATARHVVFADWIFTTTSVIVQPLTGFWMIALGQWSYMQVWIWLSLVLYIIAGICWLPVVWLQIQIRSMAENAVKNNTKLPDLYYRYMTIWLILGWPAFFAIIIVFFLMVFKPVSLF